MVKRYLTLIFGLSVMSLGIAFSIKASLGTSPISSLPYVLSLICPLTVGNLTIIMHSVFILMQLLLLRRSFQPVQFLQLPVAFIFGYLTDLAVWLTRSIVPETYLSQWAVCLIGIILVGIGVSFEVCAGVVTLAGEGLVLALCKVFPFKFGYAKVGVDASLVILASLSSFLWLGHLAGVREGTAAAALCVGLIAKECNRRINPHLTRFFEKDKKKK